MKKIIMVIFCSSVILSVSAQVKEKVYQVKGQIIENIKGEGVPYATVVISADSLKEKKAMACDANGNFSINLDSARRYQLTVTSVGYKQLDLPFLVTTFKTDLGKISIEQGIELQEVTVTAQKPLVKVDPDKIVYSMEADPEAQTNNALEMLRKVPLVNVDSEDNITLNGQSNFKILLNGKTSSMLSSNSKDVLKSMPANTIKNIEVITNPSSKYDAEGVGGIINIVTTKKTLSGYNGSISSGMDSRGSFNGSLYLASKIKKFSFSGRYFGNQFREPKSTSDGESEFYNVTDYHYSNTKSVSDYKGLSNGYSGEASYDIDSLNLISLSFWGYQYSYTNRGSGETQFRNTGNDITRFYNTITEGNNNFSTLSGNIDYQKTYKKPDKSLTFSYKLDNDPRKVRNNTYVTGLTNYPSYGQRSDNEANGREQTFQADYYDPVTEKHQAEGGLKFILRQNTSISEIYRNDTLKLNSNNDLDYDQYILGAYAGYLFKWKKISTKTGMRLERTWNDGISKAAGSNTYFTNRLVNLIPYITFNFMPKQGQTIKVSYTQRLSRPGIWYLNPYIDNSDSLNINYGNPSLKAELSHSFELGYTLFKPKFNLSATTYSSFINNSIESISRIEDNGATATTYENIGKNQTYGLNLYLSYRPTNKLSINLNGGGGYAKLESNNSYAISNEGFSYRGFMNIRWTAWKDGTVSSYAGLYSPSIMLQGKSSSFYYTSFGVSQYLLKRKLMLNLSMTDPFWKTKEYKYETGDMTFFSQSIYKYVARNLRFSLTYNFGQMDLQVKKARRGINNDDLKGGGDSKGSGGAGVVQ
jgi:outer membrane receptor protein involved in Fe transport